MTRDNFWQEKMMSENVRWKQRFQNFEKAFNLFERMVSDYQKNLNNEVSQVALIHAFEVVMELSWKTLKDYLLNEGSVVNSPKEVLRQSFQYGVIDDGELWMEALAKRNLTTHTYDEAIFKEVLVFIVDDFDEILKKLYLKFKTEANL